MSKQEFLAIQADAEASLKRLNFLLVECTDEHEAEMEKRFTSRNSASANVLFG